MTSKGSLQIGAARPRRRHRLSDRHSTAHDNCGAAAHDRGGHARLDKTPIR
jgi:hypothetical protein